LTYRTLALEQYGYVLKITLNQPEKRNPLNETSIAELTEAIRAADQNTDIRCIVLTGAGSAFSAGGDLTAFAKNLERPAPDHYEKGRNSVELFRLAAEVRTPVITAVNGHAMGGGCGIAAMSHMCIASDRAVFGTTEIKLGLFPFVIFPWIVRAVGEKKALELAFTGGIYSAEEARDIGLVQKVVPHERLMEETMHLAETIASRSPLVLKLGLEAYHKTRDLDLKDALDYLYTLRIVSFMSEDLKEGAQSFLEKRSPNWKGR
jgi:enoyl-CoA hydratase/carnithine racemase